MKIDFYVLETSSGQQSLLFACRLLEKLHAEEKKSVFVQVSSRNEAERFDGLLWTYRDDSFIPHTIYNPLDDDASAIAIGFDDNQAPEDYDDVLLNLARDIPDFHGQFAHVIEIVFNDPLVQQLARERYKQYRDQGHTINTIKIKANET